MKRLICLLFALFSIISLPNAQEQPAVDLPPKDNGDAIFAPFVSRIRVGQKENSIVLLWEDSRDVAGENLIFRHTQEITESNFNFAEKIGQVPAGVETYIDNPHENGSYYYCILVKPPQNNAYELFVPFKNKTIAGIPFEKNRAIQDSSKQFPVAEITELNAVTLNSSIQIMFKSSIKERRFIIYRGIEEFKETRDLLEATPAGIVSESDLPFIDFPVPGIEYYYAVIDENFLKNDHISLLVNSNTTSKSISLPVGTNLSGLPVIKKELLRPIPLPNLILNIEISDGVKLKSNGIYLPMFKELGVETQKATKELLANGIALSPKLPFPVILPTESSGLNFGENYTLSTIINSDFMMENYDNTVFLIEKFLSIYRTNSTKARARFYLGQCLTFKGEYRKAFFQFLLAEDETVENLNVWKNFLLSQFRKQRD